jgi:hypothetical protein
VSVCIHVIVAPCDGVSNKHICVLSLRAVSAASHCASAIQMITLTDDQEEADYDPRAGPCCPIANAASMCVLDT